MAATQSATPVSSLAALETFLGFLETSSSANELEALPTPHIDRILRHYKRREGGSEAVEGGRERRGRADSSSSSACWGERGFERRLMQLEQQLTQLLQRSKHAHTRSSEAKKTVVGSPLCINSDSSSDDASPHSKALPTQHSNTFAARPNVGVTSSTRPHPSAVTMATRTRERQLGRRSSGRGRGGGGGGGGGRERREGGGKEKENAPSSKREGARAVSKREGREGVGVGMGVVNVRSVTEDRQLKTQLLREADTQRESEAVQAEPPNKQVVQELEGERERRAKAEEAVGRLVEHVRSLQHQTQEAGRARELTVARVAQLETELRAERGRIVETKEEGRKLEEFLSVVRRELEVAQGSLREQTAALNALQEEERQRDTTHLRERSELMGRVRDAELASSGHQKEVELVRETLAEARKELQQMQQLLTAREREYQRAMEHHDPLSSREVQEAVSREVERERERERERGESLLKQQRVRLEEQQKAYQELEEEFRAALRIEATRYQELQQSSMVVQEEGEGLRKAAEEAVRREHRATKMVAELTAIVREQKGRLLELGRAKEDTVNELRERVRELETDVKDKHKLEVKVQTLQEENSQLSVRLSAQSAVLDGLREEQGLWSEELARQGAGLARDRGRLEAQVEALTRDSSALRDELQSARDCVRIKEKIVSEQQATIGRLREEVERREREGEEGKREGEEERRSLLLQLEQEEEATRQLQEQLSAVVERKERLKEEVSAVRAELEQWKSKFSKLRGQWEERVQVIGGLEQSLAQLQETFSQRETTLAREREQAELQAREAAERCTANKEAHRRQLDEQQRSHDGHMSQLVEQKNLEIEAANKKVIMVEKEMRELLTEVTQERRVMEGRTQRLSQALQELQHSIT